MQTLKKGSKGDDVIALQHLLNVEGYKLTIDGDFGAKTETAVKMYQKAHGLEDDGIVGAKTWAAINTADNYWTKRKITEIIVHCSATKEGQAVSVADIRKWHLQRGFADIMT